MIDISQEALYLRIVQGRSQGLISLNTFIHPWWEKELPIEDKYLLKGVPSHISASLTTQYHLQLLVLVKDVCVLREHFHIVATA